MHGNRLPASELVAFNLPLTTIEEFILCISSPTSANPFRDCFGLAHHETSHRRIDRTRALEER